MSFFVLSLLVPSQLAIDLYMPSIPHMIAPLHTTAARVQLSLAAYIFPYAFTPLIIGPMSDRWGRRWLLLLGFIAYTVGAFFSALSNTIGFLLWMRAITGVGGGMLGLFSRAIMRDAFEGPALRRISSYQAAVWAFVPLAAPVIGGYLQHLLGWRANFFALALVGALLFCIFLLFYPETKKVEERQHFQPKVLLRNYWKLIGDREALGYVTIVFFQYGAYTGLILASPFLLQTQLGLTPPEYGWAMFFVGLGVMIGALISSGLSHRLALKTVMWGGVVLGIAAAATLLGLPLATLFTLMAYIIPALFLVIAFGIVWPNAAAGCMQIYPELSGSAAAIIPLFASVGGGVISLIVAKLPEQNPIPLATTLLILMGLSGLVLLLISKRRWGILSGR